MGTSSEGSRSKEFDIGALFKGCLFGFTRALRASRSDQNLELGFLCMHLHLSFFASVHLSVQLPIDQPYLPIRLPAYLPIPPRRSHYASISTHIHVCIYIYINIQTSACICTCTHACIPLDRD